MRDYKLYEIEDGLFEDLINMICRKILGIGAINFSKGRDGGRDGRFQGTAEKYPSSREPWTGGFVIQAKHTCEINSSCSDPGFFGNQSSVINRECQKLVELHKKEPIDNYLIFTNRKLPAGIDEKIRTFIREETGIQNIGIHGLEYITSLLVENPEIVKNMHLDQWRGPLRFESSDLKEVISTFYEHFGKEKPLESFEEPVRDLAEKNRLNALSERYFRLIRDKH